MKILLEKVKIYGYDPAVFRTYVNEGVETKQYSVPLYISCAQRALIDSYIYGKCETTRDGENLFYGKNKQQIPVFDSEKNRIEKPINEVFIADVSILIDEFTNKNGEQIRYSKCLGIRYLHPVANEEPRVVVFKNYDSYDQIFESENEQQQVQVAKESSNNDYVSEAPCAATEPTLYAPEPPVVNDLPF